MALPNLKFFFFNCSNSFKLPKNQQDNEEYIASVTTKAFAQMVQKMSGNILMKCHNYFLVVASRDISGRLLKDISAFDEKAIDQMFELEKSKISMKQQENLETKNLQTYDNQEKVLRDLVTLFSRFKLG